MAVARARVSDHLVQPRGPNGTTPRHFMLDVIGVGRGSAAARGRIGELSVEELKAEGVTREDLVRWRDFLEDVVEISTERGRTNPSAPGRVALFDSLIDAFDRADGT